MKFESSYGKNFPHLFFILIASTNLYVVVNKNAPTENNVAALIPRSLMNPRKKLFVPKKTPARKLGTIKNLRGLSSSDSTAPSSL